MLSCLHNSKNASLPKLGLTPLKHTGAAGGALLVAAAMPAHRGRARHRHQRHPGSDHAGGWRGEQTPGYRSASSSAIAPHGQGRGTPRRHTAVHSLATRRRGSRRYPSWPRSTARSSPRMGQRPATASWRAASEAITANHLGPDAKIKEVVDQRAGPGQTPGASPRPHRVPPVVPVPVGAVD